MRVRRAVLLGVAQVSLATGVAVAQPAPERSPGSANALSGTPRLPRLELQYPSLLPLRSTFSTAPTPGYEMQMLPTFQHETVWWQSGALSLRSVTQAAPAFELDCTLGCQPLIERSAGAEARLQLGGRSASVVPSYHLFLRVDRHQAPSAASDARFRAARVQFGLAGLLDL